MPDKKLTDNEIIKAIERCMIPIGRGGCQGCPMYNEEKRLKKLFKMIIDLINRLQEENERLQSINDSFTDIGKLYSEIKAEAYKECIEKVKEHSNKMELVCSGALVRTDYTITKEKLDNLLKEMVGESNV